MVVVVVEEMDFVISELFVVVICIGKTGVELISDVVSTSLFEIEGTVVSVGNVCDVVDFVGFVSLVMSFGDFIFLAVVSGVVPLLFRTVVFS